MFVNPREGQRVKVWYRRIVRDHMPWHGRTGVVVIRGTGKPRNHGVQIDDGPMITVPCGNLYPDPGDSEWPSS